MGALIRTGSRMLVDSHCHLDRLDLSPWDGDMAAMLADARAAGVGGFLCVSIDMENVGTVKELAARHDQVWASVGVHPNETGGPEPDMEALLSLADDPNVVAIGETGLDYFRSEGDLDWQRDRFRRHIRVARECGKPLIIHTRESTPDVLAILREEKADEVGGVMHCFVDDWASAQAAMDMNFYISISGIVTFRNAAQVKDVASRVPEQRLLVETDSPYLAPVPKRGKPNYPAYTHYVAEHVAELRQTSLENIARTTTDNFFRLFSAAAHP